MRAATIAEQGVPAEVELGVGGAEMPPRPVCLASNTGVAHLWGLTEAQVMGGDASLGARTVA